MRASQKLEELFCVCLRYIRDTELDEVGFLALCQASPKLRVLELARWDLPASEAQLENLAQKASDICSDLVTIDLRCVLASFRSVKNIR
jgi:hypothetical protein